MSNHDDLDWLAALQPAPLAPAADATRSARTALVTHATGRRAPLATAPTAPVRRAPERRWIRPSRILALTAVATTAAVAALAIGGGGGGGRVVGVAPAAAAPLVQLSHAVQRSAAQPGDATLVLRTQQVTGRPAFSGADLYLDNGHYYYSDTLAGLPAAIAAGDTGGDDLWIERYLAAAVGALHTDIATARSAMEIANLDPAQSAQDRAADEQAAVAEKEAARARLLQEGKAVAPAHPPLTPEEHANGMIWSNALQAMLAGGSRPDVRAGVLRLLATIPAVTVTPGTVDGRSTLELSGPVLSGYVEKLVIDADSGLPLQLVGGSIGKAPSVVVTYTVTRVTAAEIAQG